MLRKQSSWRTSVAGIVVIVLAALSLFLRWLDPAAETVFSWEQAVAAIVGMGLLSAKDESAN